MSDQSDSKQVKIKVKQVCGECGRDFPPGTSMKVFKASRPQEDYTEYKRAYICFDCAKYYKRKAPKIF